MPPSSGQAGLDDLIQRHVTLSELRRRLADEGDEAARRELARGEGPWVTVSKQLGAGGRALAGRVAEALGWQVFDKEVVEAIARNTHTRSRILSRLDERAIGRFEQLIASLFVPSELGQPVFVHEMIRVIWALARDGHAVLLGRGGNWLLDPRHGLRVRTVAPVEERVAVVAGRLGVSPAEARERIIEDDAGRVRFIRQVYGRDIDDPLGYDLVINTAHIEPGAAVQTILTALRQKTGAAARR